MIAKIGILSQQINPIINPFKCNTNKIFRFSKCFFNRFLMIYDKPNEFNESVCMYILKIKIFNINNLDN